MNTSEIRIGNVTVGGSNPVFVIAEAGLNHGGDLELAKKMIKAAASSGANAVKFQAFITEKRFAKGSDEYNLVKETEFGFNEFKTLSKTAEENNIIFFATAFDKESLDVLLELEIPIIKIASCDIGNKSLLSDIAEAATPVIISRGTATMNEIKNALAFFSKKKLPHILLHCVSSYPLKEKNANLGAIAQLKETFSVPVGYSDHTTGISIPLYSVFAGARVIEKHFTCDRSLKGIDYEISANPEELKQLISGIREAEKILGEGKIEPLLCESEEIEYRNKFRMDH